MALSIAIPRKYGDFKIDIRLATSVIVVLLGKGWSHVILDGKILHPSGEKAYL